MQPWNCYNAAKVDLTEGAVNVKTDSRKHLADMHASEMRR